MIGMYTARRAARGMLLLSGTAVSMLAASSAWAQATVATEPQVDAAQSSANPAVPTESQGQDIIVTALKRGTALQSTPISISAITPQQLANSGVRSIADLGSQVPSLSFVDGGPSNRRVVIRGIQATGEPTVGVYYDETAVTGVVGASNDAGGSTPELRLFDVERVEVLRGPQGTLYGSGSMGGTLRIIYKKPTFQTEGAIDATGSVTHHGGLNSEINGAINIPVVQDKVAVRVVGFHRFDNGYIDNVYLHVKDINDTENYGGRFLVRVKPTETLTIDGAAYYNRSTTDTPSWTANVGTYQTDSRIRLPVRDKVQLYSGTARWELGGVVATGVVSYMDRTLSSMSDTSRYIGGLATAANYNRLCTGTTCTSPTTVVTPITSLGQYLDFVNAQSVSGLFPQQNLKALTAELRLSSSGTGPINWTVGGFYSRRKTNVANPQVNADPRTGIVIQPEQIDTVRYIDDVLKQVAAFADLSWDITSKLNITGGARYFKYTKDVVGRTDVPSILVGARVTPPTALSSNEDGTVVKVNASYKFTRDIMFYFEAAQGFRPGGVNQVLGLDAALTPYRSDSLWNYEAGFKTSWLNRTVTANIDVFRIDWTNIQVTQRTPNGAFSYIGNAAAARVQGVEFESSVRPVHGLNLTGNATYMSAKLTQNQLAANLATASSGRAGDRIPYVPKFTAGASAQYSWPLTTNFNGLVRADFNHSGGYYSDFRPSYVYTRHINSYDLVNARIGVEAPDGNWGAYLFVNNLLDKVAITRASSSAIGVGLTSVTSALPRTVGVNLRKSF